jgi:hypothetical protein
MHLELKCFALLVVPSLLEAFVMDSDGDDAMGLSVRNAGWIVGIAGWFGPERSRSF